MNIKFIAYRVFGLIFRLCRVFPVDGNKTFLIATHDDGPEGNIALAASAIKRKAPGMRFVKYTRKDRMGLISFFIVKAYHLATSGIVLLDNEFLPMAYTPFSKKTTVIQLWHGTGTIKKFGLDAENEKIAKLAKAGNQRIDHLIVGGERTKRQYASAFGIAPDHIRMTGLPRTDLLLDEEYIVRRKKAFLKWMGKKIKDPEKYRYILYAPTFRDAETSSPGLMIGSDFLDGLADDVILLLRFHPFVADAFSAEFKKRGDSGRVVDVSHFNGVTTLMSAADILITDYSSITFEYALLGRPMIFYAYDLDDFEANGRDFYEPYEEFVPGPVVRTEGELSELAGRLLSGDEEAFDRDKTALFIKDNYHKIDGHASERVAALALKKTRRE